MDFDTTPFSDPLDVNRAIWIRICECLGGNREANGMAFVNALAGITKRIAGRPGLELVGALSGITKRMASMPLCLEVYRLESQSEV